MFRRRTVPGYTGGLPGGYGYINNAVAGTPAPVAVARIGGPDEDTLYVGLGEDTRAENVNRGLDALSQNTDIIDDTLRRDLAVPVRHTTNSVVLPVGTYLGPTGTLASAVGYRQLFTIVDLVTGQEARVLNVPCAVTSVTLGGGDTIGSDQFSASTVSLTISPTPPNNFSVLYYGRSNQALHLRDVWFNAVRKAEQGLWSYLESSIYATPAALELVGTGDNTVSVPAGMLVSPDTAGFTGPDFTAVVVTDSYGRRIRTNNDVTGAYVSVVSIAAGAVDAEGFTTTSRLVTLSATIPLGMDYVVHYGVRKSLLLSGVANYDLLTALNRNLYLSAQQPFRGLPETITAEWFFSDNITASSNAWNLHQAGGEFGNVDTTLDFSFINADVYLTDSELRGTDARILLTLDPDYANILNIPELGEFRIAGLGAFNVTAPTAFTGVVSSASTFTFGASLVIPTVSSGVSGPRFVTPLTLVNYVVGSLYGYFLDTSGVLLADRIFRPVGSSDLPYGNALPQSGSAESDPLLLPNGATITNVTCQINPVAAAATRFGFSIRRFSVLTGAFVDTTVVYRDPLVGTGPRSFSQDIDPIVIDRNSYIYRLNVHGSNDNTVDMLAVTVRYSLSNIDLRYV